MAKVTEYWVDLSCFTLIVPQGTPSDEVYELAHAKLEKMIDERELEICNIDVKDEMEMDWV